MFNKNKRRNKSTYLDMENGEVVTSSENIVKNISARSFDDFSDEDLEDESPIELEVKNGLPVCSPTVDTYEDEVEDTTVSDMKATIFNIFKFIFIFCVFACVAYLFYKSLPVVENTINEMNVNQNSNQNTNSTSEQNNQSSSFLDEVKREKEKEKMIVTMNKMNEVNNQLKLHYEYIKTYCLDYSNNVYTVYIHEKNMSTLKNDINTQFINFLNTEETFESEYDKELFALYKQRYQNLFDCITFLNDGNGYNRANVMEKINGYIYIDNDYNEKEFDVLITYLNLNGLSYTITDTAIILND